jgi:protein-S-isoprenylcysteine O-methyltransferase Ste14
MVQNLKKRSLRIAPDERGDGRTTSDTVRKVAFHGATWLLLAVRTAGAVVCFSSLTPGLFVLGLAELVAVGLGLANVLRHVRADVAGGGLLVPGAYAALAVLSPIGSGGQLAELITGSAALALLFCRVWLGASFTAGGTTWLGLVDSGPYAFVRHPLLALALAVRCTWLVCCPSWWNAFACLAGGALVCLVVWREERFLLLHVAEYRRYAQRVRARFVPGLF